MNDHPLQTLQDAFSELDDPRMDRTKEHRLLDIVAIAICAVICGADSWVAVEEFGKTKHTWLRTFLELPNGIPSHATFTQGVPGVFAALDADQFQHSFLRWIRIVWPTVTGDIVAVDGKTLRGAHDRGIGKDAIHMVSAWAGQARLVLAQRKVDDKSNEITVIPEVLQVLALAGCTVTIDALGCQTAIAKQIVQQGGDYVLAVKENQEQLYRDIVDTFRYAAADDWCRVAHAHYRTVTGEHGRLETREAWLIHDPDVLAYLDPKGRWKGLSGIGMLETERISDGTSAYECRYYILSGTPSARAFAEAVRGHWGIENSVHWVLDVTFREDHSRVRTGNAPQNFAVLRHIALNLLRHEPSTGSINTKRFRAALDEQYLLKVLQA